MATHAATADILEDAATRNPDLARMLKSGSALPSGRRRAMFDDIIATTRRMDADESQGA